MGKILSEGICLLCNTNHSKGSMWKHLEACRIKSAISADGEEPPQKTRVFHMVVEGRYLSGYWMHFDIPVNAALADIDFFLRNIWLECCGHLSAFTIYGRGFASNVKNDDGENDMNVALSKALETGTKFFYEYDFGSTTDLVPKVLAERKSAKKTFQLLARNTAPAIPCNSCGGDAESICVECACSGEGWLCEKCAQGHGCGEDMLLPVVNSPRVGVCAYTGL